MTKVTMPEPVAVIASDYALFWAGSGPIAPLCERTGTKVGSLLITTNQAEAYANTRVREALEAAKQLADWAEFEVGAEPELTPGLQAIRALLPSTPARPESEQ